MKRILLVLLLAMSAHTSVSAQTETDSVRIIIDKLFSSIKSTNPATFWECFGDSAIVQTVIRDKNGMTTKTIPLIDFINQIANMGKDAADIRYGYDVIRIDGALAMVWVPYQFYYNGQFSYCGVHSFQLVKQKKDGWRIKYMVDTRRRQDCVAVKP